MVVKSKNNPFYGLTSYNAFRLGLVSLAWCQVRGSSCSPALRCSSLSPGPPTTVIEFILTLATTWSFLFILTVGTTWSFLFIRRVKGSVFVCLCIMDLLTRVGIHGSAVDYAGVSCTGGMEREHGRQTVVKSPNCEIPPDRD